MDISDLPTLEFPLVEGELEYYPFGEAHLHSPTDEVGVTKSTWDETEKVDLAFHSTESRASIVADHHAADDDVESYRFRITDFPKLRIRVQDDPENVPINVYRAIAFCGFEDPTAPTPNRPHGFDYLCSLLLPLQESTTEMNPLLQTAAVALSANLKVYALSMSIEVSFASSDLNFEDINFGEYMGSILSSGESRLAIAQQLAEKFELAEYAILPKFRTIHLTETESGSPPDQPPFTIPATTDHHGQEFPFVNIQSINNDEPFVIADALTRFSLQRYRFRYLDRDNRRVVLQNPGNHSPDGLPPLPVIYELYTRGITVQNIPQIPEGESLLETLQTIDALVAHVSEAFETPLNDDGAPLHNYRDLYTMLYALATLRQRSPRKVYDAIKETTGQTELPLEQYATNPIQSQGDLASDEMQSKVTELLSAPIQEIAPDHVEDTLEDLRWDAELNT